MIRYSFKEDFVAIKNAKGADPQKIGEALEAIAVANGGTITPAVVLETAKDPKNPLHAHFEWDDGKAAIAYRMDQAREIVRVIRVEDEDEEPRQAFLSISDGGGTAYHRVGDVMRSSGLQLRVLAQAERDLQAWERRYSSLSDICDLVKVAREKTAAKKQELESRV